jgi:hypothetical protein
MKKSRLFLWIIVVALSGTGIALHFLTGNAEELPHPLSGLFRSLHGVVSAAALFMFGYFFSDHIQKKRIKYKHKWHSHLWDAYFHFTVWILLITTGLLLYYPPAVLEELNVNMGSIHWYLGLILSGLFPFHFWRKSITRYYARKRWEESQVGKSVKSKSISGNKAD